ncbi:response regulator [Sphingomonas sp. LHG3406-1]|uniref:response regulator n=1 Tax=Sphingomonas sp. LHG3406-1 TaxID=2804617 RepID=UPI00262116FF|nr:response regulator [Sphingomonas sp. LHG3406-1]
MLFGTRERHVKRILIVEDEPLVAFDNEMMVEAAGYTVVATVDRVGDALAVLAREQVAGTEEDGEEAEERGVDLILTDLTLTGQRSGLDLAVEAKKLGVPVLFATAEPPEGGEALAMGVLLKPYNERRLKAALKAIEQLLAGKTKVKAPEGVILFPAPLAA